MSVSRALTAIAALVGGVVIVSGIIYCLKRDCGGT
jgi:hypothetical protein